MKRLFADLSETDLKALIHLFDSGRLQPPYREASLIPTLAKDRARSVVGQLISLTTKGATPALIADILKAVQAERGAAPREDELLELVWTGPESAESSIRDTSVVVRELFRAAQEKIIVAGFAIYGGRRLFGELAKRMTEVPDLRTSFFLNVHRAQGDTSTAESILARFADDFRARQWPATRLPDVYFDPRSLETHEDGRASMHAKCIVVDGRIAFVTSANFTEAAQRRNVEVGVLIRSASLARKLGSHFEALAHTGHFRPVPGLA